MRLYKNKKIPFQCLPEQDRVSVRLNCLSILVLQRRL